MFDIARTYQTDITTRKCTCGQNAWKRAYPMLGFIAVLNFVTIIMVISTIGTATLILSSKASNTKKDCWTKSDDLLSSFPSPNYFSSCQTYAILTKEHIKKHPSCTDTVRGHEKETVCIKDAEFQYQHYLSFLQHKWRVCAFAYIYYRVLLILILLPFFSFVVVQYCCFSPNSNYYLSSCQTYAKSSLKYYTKKQPPCTDTARNHRRETVYKKNHYAEFLYRHHIWRDCDFTNTNFCGTLLILSTLLLPFFNFVMQETKYCLSISETVIQYRSRKTASSKTYICLGIVLALIYLHHVENIQIVLSFFSVLNVLETDSTLLDSDPFTYYTPCLIKTFCKILPTQKIKTARTARFGINKSTDCNETINERTKLLVCSQFSKLKRVFSKLFEVHQTYFSKVAGEGNISLFVSLPVEQTAFDSEISIHVDMSNDIIFSEPCNVVAEDCWLNLQVICTSWSKTISFNKCECHPSEQNEREVTEGGEHFVLCTKSCSKSVEDEQITPYSLNESKTNELIENECNTQIQFIWCQYFMSHLLIMLLLILAGDVETNPGPPPSGKSYKPNMSTSGESENYSTDFSSSRNSLNRGTHNFGVSDGHISAMAQKLANGMKTMREITQTILQSLADMFVSPESAEDKVFEKKWKTTHETFQDFVTKFSLQPHYKQLAVEIASLEANAYAAFETIMTFAEAVIKDILRLDSEGVPHKEHALEILKTIAYKLGFIDSLKTTFELKSSRIHYQRHIEIFDSGISPGKDTFEEVMELAKRFTVYGTEYKYLVEVLIGMTGIVMFPEIGQILLEIGKKFQKILVFEKISSALKVSLSTDEDKKSPEKISMQDNMYPYHNFYVSEPRTLGVVYCNGTEGLESQCTNTLTKGWSDTMKDHKKYSYSVDKIALQSSEKQRRNFSYAHCRIDVPFKKGPISSTQNTSQKATIATSLSVDNAVPCRPPTTIDRKYQAAVEERELRTDATGVTKPQSTCYPHDSSFQHPQSAKDSPAIVLDKQLTREDVLHSTDIKTIKNDCSLSRKKTSVAEKESPATVSSQSLTSNSLAKDKALDSPKIKKNIQMSEATETSQVSTRTHTNKPPPTDAEARKVASGSNILLPKRVVELQTKIPKRKNHSLVDTIAPLKEHPSPGATGRVVVPLEEHPSPGATGRVVVPLEEHISLVDTVLLKTSEDSNTHFETECEAKIGDPQMVCDNIPDEKSPRYMHQTVDEEGCNQLKPHSLFVPEKKLANTSAKKEEMVTASKISACTPTDKPSPSDAKVKKENAVDSAVLQLKPLLKGATELLPSSDTKVGVASLKEHPSTIKRGDCSLSSAVETKKEAPGNSDSDTHFKIERKAAIGDSQMVYDNIQKTKIPQNPQSTDNSNSSKKLSCPALEFSKNRQCGEAGNSPEVVVISQVSTCTCANKQLATDAEAKNVPKEAACLKIQPKQLDKKADEVTQSSKIFLGFACDNLCCPPESSLIKGLQNGCIIPGQKTPGFFLQAFENFGTLVVIVRQANQATVLTIRLKVGLYPSIGVNREVQNKSIPGRLFQIDKLQKNAPLAESHRTIQAKDITNTRCSHQAVDEKESDQLETPCLFIPADKLHCTVDTAVATIKKVHQSPVNTLTAMAPLKNVYNLINSEEKPVATKRVAALKQEYLHPVNTLIVASPEEKCQNIITVAALEEEHYNPIDSVTVAATNKEHCSSVSGKVAADTSSKGKQCSQVVASEEGDQISVSTLTAAAIGKDTSGVSLDELTAFQKKDTSLIPVISTHQPISSDEALDLQITFDQPTQTQKLKDTDKIHVSKEDASKVLSGSPEGQCTLPSSKIKETLVHTSLQLNSLDQLVQLKNNILVPRTVHEPSNFPEEVSASPVPRIKEAGQLFSEPVKRVEDDFENASTCNQNYRQPVEAACTGTSSIAPSISLCGSVLLQKDSNCDTADSRLHTCSQNLTLSSETQAAQSNLELCGNLDEHTLETENTVEALQCSPNLTFSKQLSTSSKSDYSTCTPFEITCASTPIEYVGCNKSNNTSKTILETMVATKNGFAHSNLTEKPKCVQSTTSGLDSAELVNPKDTRVNDTVALNSANTEPAFIHPQTKRWTQVSSDNNILNTTKNVCEYPAMVSQQNQAQANSGSIAKVSVQCTAANSGAPVQEPCDKNSNSESVEYESKSVDPLTSSNSYKLLYQQSSSVTSVHDHDTSAYSVETVQHSLSHISMAKKCKMKRIGSVPHHKLLYVIKPCSKEKSTKRRHFTEDISEDSAKNEHFMQLICQEEDSFSVKNAPELSRTKQPSSTIASDSTEISNSSVASSTNSCSSVFGSVKFIHTGHNKSKQTRHEGVSESISHRIYMSQTSLVRGKERIKTRRVQIHKPINKEASSDCSTNSEQVFGSYLHHLLTIMVMKFKEMSTVEFVGIKITKNFCEKFLKTTGYRDSFSGNTSNSELQSSNYEAVTESAINEERASGNAPSSHIRSKGQEADVVHNPAHEEGEIASNVQADGEAWLAIGRTFDHQQASHNSESRESDHNLQSGPSRRRQQPEWINAVTQLLHVPDYPKMINRLNTEKPISECFVSHRFIRGIAYFKIGKFQQAMKDLIEGERYAQEIDEKGGVSLCNVYLGDLYYSSHSYKEAAKSYQKATEYHDSDSIAKQFRMVAPSLSAIHAKCGSCFRTLSKSVEAIQEYKKAINSAKKEKDKLTAHTSLGNLYQSTGQNKEALKEYQQALELARRLNDHISVAWTHGNIGNAYLGLGMKDKALFNLKKALDLTVKYEPTPAAIGRAYNNIGTAYQSMGDLDKAEEHYDLALSQAIYGNDPAGQARVYGNIGNSFIVRKIFDKAIPHYSEVLRLSTDESTVTTALHNRGCAYYEWAESKMTALEKSSSSKTDPAPGQVVSTNYYEWAESKMTALEKSSSRTEPTSRQVIFRVHGSKSASQEHSPRIVIDSIFKLYKQGKEDLERVLASHEGKLNHIKGSTKGLSLSVSLFESNSRTFHRLQDCMVNLGNWREALLVAEQSKARTLGEMMLARKGTQLDHPLTSPLSIEQVYTIVSSQTSPILYLSHTGASILGWVLVPTKGSTTIFMEMFEVPLADDQFDGKSFDYHIRYNLTEILVEQSYEMYSSEKYSDVYTAPVVTLFELIGRPLLTILTKVMNIDTRQKLVVVTDTYTTLLPFACMYDPDNEKFLGEMFHFDIVPSLLTMGIMNQLPEPVVELPADPQNMCIIGNPTIPQFYHNDEVWSLGKLPYAKREAQWVGHILNTPPILEEQATKSAILMRFMRAKVIHIATHGSSVSGFLAFSALTHTRQGEVVDSSSVLLHPEEVEKLSLNVALVVLSSCDSARGTVKADGIQGMARAFILAGAQAVLTALWRVPDESAAVFMRFFYRFLEEGFESSLALQKSILSLRCFAKYSQYIHWSGYQLTGRSIRFDTKPSSVTSILEATLGLSSVFPRLMLVKKLQSALVENPRFPTDIQILHGAPGVNPSEVAVDFIHSSYKFFAAGIFWLNCGTPEQIDASLLYIEKVIKKSLYKLQLNETQQALFILDSLHKLPSHQLLRLFKHTNVHIIILSKVSEQLDPLVKEIDKVLIRGTKIHEVKTLSTIDSTQRTVYEIFRKYHLSASNDDQKVFEMLAEFTSGSPLIVEIAIHVLLKYIGQYSENPSIGLAEFSKSIQLKVSRKTLPKSNAVVCREISAELSRIAPAVVSVPPDHKDVWETESEYDSWDSIATLLDCCISSPGELLLLRSLAIFGCCPIPLPLVITMSSFIAQSSGHSHLSGILHERLMEAKLLRRYPLPVVLHSSYTSDNVPKEPQFVYVPQHLASHLWTCEQVDQMVAITLAFKAFEKLKTSSNHCLFPQEFYLGLISVLEEKAGIIKEMKTCYEYVCKLYLDIRYCLSPNSVGQVVGFY